MPSPKAGISIEQRKGRLKQLLHIGKAELGWDEDFYREVLVSVSRDPARNSSTQLTLQELDLVLDRMKAGGFKVRTKRGTRAKASSPTASKITALWLELHRLGYVRDSSDKALGSYVQRITQVAAVQWLSNDQTRQVIESLKKWLRRDRAKIEALVASLIVAGRLDESAVDIGGLCLKVTGQPELTKAAAEVVIAYLEGASK